MGKYDVKMSGKKFDYEFLTIASSYGDSKFNVLKKDGTSNGEMSFKMKVFGDVTGCEFKYHFIYKFDNFKLEINATKKVNDKKSHTLEEEEIIELFEETISDFPLV